MERWYWIELIGFDNESSDFGVDNFLSRNVTTTGVSLLFYTYISPEAYELLVKEVSKKFGFETGRTKLVYDISSLLLSTVLALVFFGIGDLKGIGIGTEIAAVLNGILIGAYCKIYNKFISFKDIF